MRDATHTPHTRHTRATSAQRYVPPAGIGANHRLTRPWPSTVHPEFVARAQAEHEFLFRAETQIPCVVVTDSTPKSHSLPWAPSPPPSPPSRAARLPASPKKPQETGPPQRSSSLSVRWSRRQGASPPSGTRKGLKLKLDETKIPGVEYSLQKLDQLRARLRLILSQHLVASKYYMHRYYALSFPSITLSSFLTVISLIIPRLSGCDAPIEGAPPRRKVSLRTHTNQGSPSSHISSHLHAHAFNILHIDEHAYVLSFCCR